MHTHQTHVWHMQQIAQMAQADPELLLATQYKLIEVRDESSCTEGTTWWEALITAGGEGMVVKPMDFMRRTPKGLLQPAVKCRGPEYLRIIYGPEYTLPEHLERLRQRGGYQRSDRWLYGNLPWELRPLNDLWLTRPSAKYTNVSLGFWHWKVNLSIPGYKHQSKALACPQLASLYPMLSPFNGLLPQNIVFLGCRGTSPGFKHGINRATRNELLVIFPETTG